MKLFHKQTELLCPRCEKPVSQHVEGECPKPKKHSRRFFLGMLGAAAVAPMVADRGLSIRFVRSFDVARSSKNTFLTVEQITHEFLVAWKRAVLLQREIQRDYNDVFNLEVERIGNEPQVRA